MHTAIGSLRLRSRGEHCDRILAVEVQGCTLRSGACQTRSAKQIGEADWRRRLAMKIGDEDWRGGWRGRKQGGRKEGRKEGRGRTTVIKSNNPHLAGGEKERGATHSSQEEVKPFLHHGTRSKGGGQTPSEEAGSQSGKTLSEEEAWQQLLGRQVPCGREKFA